jgi:hypothetical protein
MVDVFFDDTLRGRVTLPSDQWKSLELAVPEGAQGVLRIRVVEPFRPVSHRDPRLLGIQVGSGPATFPAAP